MLYQTVEKTIKGLITQYVVHFDLLIISLTIILENVQIAKSFNNCHDKPTFSCVCFVNQMFKITSLPMDSWNNSSKSLFSKCIGRHVNLPFHSHSMSLHMSHGSHPISPHTADLKAQLKSDVLALQSLFLERIGFVIL